MNLNVDASKNIFKLASTGGGYETNVVKKLKIPQLSAHNKVLISRNNIRFGPTGSSHNEETDTMSNLKNQQYQTAPTE